MSYENADTDQKEWHQIHAVYRLQKYEQEDTEVQEYQEVQIGTRSYFIFISANNTMGCTDNEQDEQIDQCDKLPKL